MCNAHPLLGLLRRLIRRILSNNDRMVRDGVNNVTERNKQHNNFKLPAVLRYELAGILLLAVGIFSLLSVLGFEVGNVGRLLRKIFLYLLGKASFAAPAIFILIGSRYVWRREAIHYSGRFFSFLAIILFSATLWHHWAAAAGQEIMPETLPKGGGLAAGFLLLSLRSLFGVDGAVVFVVAGILVAAIIAFTWSVKETLEQARLQAESRWESAGAALDRAQQTVRKRLFYNQERHRPKVAVVSTAPPAAEIPTETVPKPRLRRTSVDKPPEAETAALAEPAINAGLQQKVTADGYVTPPLTLLTPVAKKEVRDDTHMHHQARVLEETLGHFNIQAKVVHVAQGPTVTRYELEPAPGVKVSRIVALADDLALQLAASGVRIEAPIPGKAAIGIEVPNKHVAAVSLREVLESTAFQKESKPLLVGLGKDISGTPMMADLAKMPHLLVAGATGSGKSVCINGIILSLLFRASPEDVRLILVDPKVVELTNYNGIPHLLTPVVTEAKKAAAALHWAVQEMERRYALFADCGVRDIVRYRADAETDPGKEKMPYVVVIIDELADLMMAAPVDVEDAICRLAQKARAAGIHLVLATQRPSVDVITGLIKANIPSRIAFSVSSQVDSRTILDMAGAEKLLGRGDMLYYPVGAAKPLRIQGAFVQDEDIESVITYIKQQTEPPTYQEGITDTDKLADGDNKNNLSPEMQDELLPAAITVIYETGQASASMLQRKFRIGYTRAARLVDTMEEMRILGATQGSKPRDILMTEEEARRRFLAEE